MLNALTVDVEEHYNFCGLKQALPMRELERSASLVVPQTERLLDLLRRRRISATFFILGAVALRHPDLVRRIAQEGHEIATHGDQHELVYRQTPQEFEADVQRAQQRLQSLIHRPILGYRAPSFSITAQSLWALEILARLGFRYDCSVFPIRHPRYGIPDAPRVPQTWHGLTEFPLSVVRIGGVNLPVAGGAYFRLLPFSLIRQAYRRLNRAGIPIQLYLHPWELDATIPRLPVAWHRAFTHYANLHLTARRLDALLDEFAFGPVREVLGIHGD
ncbi:MAG: DUF3473 domain-containing protein [Candidatus Omnitrophica bacterium]|nr:DUF3473 domain-containing protein [Candidatus Omnitrophota bacterium]